MLRPRRSPTTAAKTLRREKQLSLSVRRALAERVRRGIAEKDNISYREIARRSGQRVSPGTITQILKAQIGDVKVITISGLARALEIDPQELFGLFGATASSGPKAVARDSNGGGR